jgi:hypothetical protein
LPRIAQGLAMGSGPGSGWDWKRRAALALAAWLTGAGVATPALAEAPADEKLDLTFERPGDPDTWIRPNVEWGTAWFAGFNAWAGTAEESLGDETNGWGEIAVVPGVDAQLSLGRYGTLGGRLSGVFTTTQLGLDWGGSNFIDGETESVQEFTLEDFYVRWHSGELVPGLDEDAIELSVGAQTYQVGPSEDGHGAGFLFQDAGFDGGSRGGYWLGPRSAFQLTAIARLASGSFFAEGVFLRSDDLGGAHTDVAGGNLHYDFADLAGIETFRLGAGYWNVFFSDDPRRDGLHVVDARLDLVPFGFAPGLRLTGEVVKEENGSLNDSWGAWGELGYDFAAHEVPCSPYVSYRYAWFSGDDADDADDNAFDPLFYGFSDWNYWYIGEISGEWITGNSNFQASIVRLRAQPAESVTTQLFWIYQRLNEFQGQLDAPGGRPVDPRVLDITDKDLSHEVDFIVDWSVNDYLSVSFVAAVLVPLKGAEQFFGRDRAWAQFMIATSVQF